MVFGFEIKKSGTFSELRNQVAGIQKVLKEYQLMRPDAETMRHSSDVDGVKIPVYYDGYHDYHRLDRLFNDSDILRITIRALINKMFRRGIEIVPIVENPSEEQRGILNKLLHRVNENDQTMKDMLKMFEQNLDVTDDAYIIIAKSYSFANGQIVGSEPKEIISAHPAYMRIISDSEGRKGYNDKGEKVYVDPTDRYKLISETEANSMNFVSREGIGLLPAHFRGELGKDYGHTSMNDNQSRYIYYIEGEVIHQSKWNPSLLYGYSNIHACWMKVITLIGQDRYFLLNYTKYRSPRALLTIGTTNYASAKKAWQELKEEAARDPHTLHPMLIENESGNKNNVQLTELLKSPQDMQLIEFRNEDRRSIGALWGVMPIFQADIQQSGGLNNETFQVDVTNISVQEGQEIYNDNIFPWITKNWGITDWAFKLREPEEDDEMEEEKLLEVKIDNATKMSGMGFQTSYDEKLKEFSYSEIATNPELLTNEPSPFMNKSLDLADARRFNKILNKVTKCADIEKSDLTKLGITFDIKKQDDSLLNFITKQLFDKVYEGMSQAKSNKINDIILNGIINKDSITVMSKAIENLGVNKTQADLISRTENAVLKNNVREFNFTKAEGSEDFVYKWLGPNDNRTSDISKEIKKKSAKGLKLETLKSLVRKTSEKFGFSPDRDWFSHPNQRHSFVRKL